jgi:hypothetical protein
MLYKTTLLVEASLVNWPHLEPSVTIMRGMDKKKARMEVMANWFPTFSRRSAKIKKVSTMHSA